MKKTLLLSMIIPFSSISFAAPPTVQDCVNELKSNQKSMSEEQKMTDKQIEAYCQCAVPQVNKLLNNKERVTEQEMKQHQEKLNQIFAGCVKQTAK